MDDLQQLKKRMRLTEDFPPSIAKHLQDMLRVATGNEEDLEDAERDARRLLEAYRDGQANASGSGAPPGRGGRDAPREIDFEPSEGTRRRGEVYNEVATIEASRLRRVQNFRRTCLQGYGLTAEAAESYLQGRESGRDKLDRSTVARNRLDRLARSLSRFYGWRENDAARFVLTGEKPTYRPVRVAVAHTENTARIVIEADAWCEVEEVENAYKSARRQMLGGDRQKIPKRSLELVAFVYRQTEEHGDRPPW